MFYLNIHWVDNIQFVNSIPFHRSMFPTKDLIIPIRLALSPNAVLKTRSIIEGANLHNHYNAIWKMCNLKHRGRDISVVRERVSYMLGCSNRVIPWSRCSRGDGKEPRRPCGNSLSILCECYFGTKSNILFCMSTKSVSYGVM